MRVYRKTWKTRGWKAFLLNLGFKVHVQTVVKGHVVIQPMMPVVPLNHYMYSGRELL